MVLAIKTFQFYEKKFIDTKALSCKLHSVLAFITKGTNGKLVLPRVNTEMKSNLPLNMGRNYLFGRPDNIVRKKNHLIRKYGITFSARVNRLLFFTHTHYRMYKANSF